MSPPRRALALLLAALLPGACSGGSSSAPPPAPAAPDPALSTLDRIIAQSGQQGARNAPPARQDTAACLERARTRHSACPASPGPEPRTLGLRLALDPRYQRWGRGWEQRLGRTLGCVNRLYQGTGLRFSLASAVSWDPGAQRHDLHALLARLQREHPPDARALSVGIAVWSQRKVYSSAGGEIGLSQGGACVVPSWPRLENDCLILAHELGHLLGARHVPGKRWIMGWAATPFHLPARDPVARVVATYRFHPRNRLAIAAHRAARLGPAGLLLPRACRALLRGADRCWQL